MQYLYKDLSEGRVEVVFEMLKEKGFWHISDVFVTTLPAVLVVEHGIQGFVRDEKTGQPVEGALVYLSGTEFSAKTDSSGFYRFLNLPLGTYTVLFVKDGYVLKTITGLEVL
ncbi:carboxypeptidase regulatory-like domain-containing protein [bacterium]|nr:carboxypeptidase regulatory-like domain-containing protein [bacterium]